LAALAACSTGPNDSDPQVTLDMAVVAAEAAAQDVEVMRGPGGPFGLRLRLDPGNFNCDPAARDGMSITRTCTYKDAAGNTQPEYNETTTASVTVHTVIDGSISRGPFSATMNRTTDLTVSGLAGAETTITWNGSGSGSSSRVKQIDGGGSRQYEMTHTGTITNVVVPVPPTDDGWPLSGTITRQVTATFTGGERDGTTVQRTVTIEFNGTQFATLTVNGETFEVDLANRRRPERRP
jgi:hypothetical protein